MSKPLLIPWLRAQIDSGSYHGVHWTNQERTEFCIPWKHGLRQDSSDSDILIFKAWAEASGNGPAQGDPSVWKRNFRSALRAKGFKMLADKKNDSANPHKVYSWPEKSASGANSSAGSQDQDEADFLEGVLPVQESQVVPNLKLDCLFLPEEAIYLESTVNQDILQECLKGLNIGPETGRLMRTAYHFLPVLPQYEQKTTVSEILFLETPFSVSTNFSTEDTAGFNAPPGQQQLENQVLIGAHMLPGQQQCPVTFEVAVSEAGLPEQPAHPMVGAVGEACGGQFVEQFIDTMNKTNDRDHFKTQFRVSVFYRGVKVSEQVVENEAGVRLVYRPELTGPIFDHESGLSVFSLPSPGAMLDQTQANLTQRILDKLGDGLDVGVSGHVVYGQRRGEIKAFWSFSKFDQSGQPQEISKLQPQPLYLFKDFLRGIMEFIEGKESYPCSLFFCLGEKWPDPDNRPWEKKLITVEVVLTSLELLKNMAVEGGASSLQSVELQMSLEEMMEMC